jgi:hypothetical protein
VELIIAPYKDPADGLDWPEQTPIIMEKLENTLGSYDEKVQFQFLEKDIGLGASWPVIAIEISVIAGTAFFAIPAAHKKIRESLQEWKLIGNKFLKLIDFISGSERVITYPIQILFLDAIAVLEKHKDVETAIFISATTITEPGSYDHLSGLYEFRFKIENEVWAIALTGERKLIQLHLIDA